MARDLRANLVVVDQASHHVNMEQPAAMARNLVTFWDRAEASAAAVSGGTDAGVAGHERA